MANSIAWKKNGLNEGGSVVLQCIRQDAILYYNKTMTGEATNA